MSWKRILPACLGSLALLAAVCTAAGATSSAGKITFCSDTTYPPMESISGGKIVGADVDIGNAIGKQMGRQVEFKTTGFDVIIPALRAKKCDAIMSALTDTPVRRAQVDFADYITVGELLMVKKGNPSHVSGLASLSGKNVAVQAATTEKDTLDAQNKKFEKAGKPKITIKIYPADTSAAAALLAGRVDAYFSDSTPVLYYIQRSGGKFETAGPQVDSAPEGIATRKGDPLGPQFKTAIAKLYANGSMQKILAKWGLGAFALKK